MEKSNKPLHQAVWDSNVAKIEYFLNKDEDVNEKDETCLRPLDIAVMTNNLEVVKLLIARKGKKVIVDFTLLYYLCRVQNDEMIPLLFNDRLFAQAKNSEGENLLHLAISHGYEKMIHRILTYHEHGIGINDRTRNGFTPLHIAVAHNRPNIFCYLLHERNMNLGAKTVDGKSVLHLAVELNDEIITTMILEKGADTNDIVTTTGLSALHIAVKKNNADMVNILLANKANLMCKDREGWNLLHLATHLGFTNLVKFFLEKGINIDSLTNADSSPLLLAIENKREEVIQILLENGANVSIKNKSGINPLCASIKNKNFKLTRKLHALGGKIQDLVEEKKSLLHVTLQYGDLGFAKLLLQKKVKINTRNKLGQTELHVAALCGNADIVQRLLKRGMDVHDTTFDQSTALHYSLNSKEITKLLIDRGIKVDAEDEDGNTALCIGAKTKCCINAFEYLLTSGANPNHLPKNKVMPLLTSIATSPDESHVPKAELLIKHGAHLQGLNPNGDTCLHAIMKYKNSCGYSILGTVDAFINLGADINSVNHDQETPLMISLQNFNCDYVIRSFVDRGAKMTKNRAGESPLHIAIRNKLSETAEYFVEKRLSIKDTTLNGSSPLHYAAQFGDANIVKVLLNAGLKVDQTNNDWKTPLHLAASYGSVETVQALIDRDANVTKKDKAWNTALHLAVSRGNLEIVKLLIKNGAFSCHKNLKGFTVYDLADQIENKHIYQCLLLN